MDKVFRALLILIPVAALLHFLEYSPIAVFFASALAIVPLAKYMAEATDALAAHTNPAIGGLLNATFGNATEIIIAIFAIRAGLFDVVQASITGSIIGNLLLVLGAAMFFGGIKYKEQSFNSTAARAQASTLLLTATALVIPAIFKLTDIHEAHATEVVIERLSILVAILMITVYVAQLLFTLRTHKHLHVDEINSDAIADTEEVSWSTSKALGILAISTIFVSLMSEILVSAIEPVAVTLGWSKLFIGVIFVAIIGNAAEHSSAVLMAIRGKMDLALQIAVGSTTQIAMFVAPLLVFISLAFGTPMSLVFNLFEVVSIVLAIFVVNQVVNDGKSNWLEGAQLMLAYLIMAVAFFFHS